MDMTASSIAEVRRAKMDALPPLYTFVGKFRGQGRKAWVAEIIGRDSPMKVRRLFLDCKGIPAAKVLTWEVKRHGIYEMRDVMRKDGSLDSGFVRIHEDGSVSRLEGEIALEQAEEISRERRGYGTTVA